MAKKDTVQTKEEVKQPDFGYMSKEDIADMIKYLVDQNPELFKRYFTLCRAMETKVTITEPDPTKELFVEK
jgi:hypothetical protein